MSATSIPLAEGRTYWDLPYRGRVGMLSLITAEAAIFSIFVVASLFYIGKSLTGPMPKDVLSDQRTLEVRCYLDGPASSWSTPRTLEVELLDGDRVISKASQKVSAQAPAPGQPALQVVTLNNLGAIRLWDLQHPSPQPLPCLPRPACCWRRGTLTYRGRRHPLA